MRLERPDKTALQVLHEEELGSVLESLGILEFLNSGKLRCKFCREIVTFETLHSLFPESGQVSIICNQSACIKQLIAYVQEKGIK